MLRGTGRQLQLRNQRIVSKLACAIQAELMLNALEFLGHGLIVRCLLRRAMKQMPSLDEPALGTEDTPARQGVGDGGRALDLRGSRRRGWRGGGGCLAPGGVAGDLIRDVPELELLSLGVLRILGGGLAGRGDGWFRRWRWRLVRRLGGVQVHVGPEELGAI